jgi:hypothetical protein
LGCFFGFRCGGGGAGTLAEPLGRERETEGKRENGKERNEISLSVLDFKNSSQSCVCVSMRMTCTNTFQPLDLIRRLRFDHSGTIKRPRIHHHSPDLWLNQKRLIKIRLPWSLPLLTLRWPGHWALLDLGFQRPERYSHPLSWPS